MKKMHLLLASFLFCGSAMAVTKEPTIPEEATIGTFLYNLEADQLRGVKLDRKYEKQREERRREKKFKKSKLKSGMDKD